MTVARPGYLRIIKVAFNTELAWTSSEDNPGSPVAHEQLEVAFAHA